MKLILNMDCEIYNDSDLWIEKQKTQEAPHKGSLAASACRCSVQISLHFENETKQTWTIEVRKIQKFPSNNKNKIFYWLFGASVKGVSIATSAFAISVLVCTVEASR